MSNISVLIPTVKISVKTRITIASIHDETFVNQILLIVDGDKKPFDHMIDTLLTDFKKLIVLTNRYDPGISGALNTGLKVATGPLIMRIDDGDEHIKNDLSRFVRMLECEYDLIAFAMEVSQNDIVTSIINPKLKFIGGCLSPFAKVPHPTWIFNKAAVKVNYLSSDLRCEFCIEQ